MGGPGLAQNKPVDNKQKQKQLEQERKKKEKEIQLTKKLLDQTQTAKKKSLTQLRLLNKQIKMREELIETVNEEITGLDEQIEFGKDEVGALQKNLEIRKQEYADMLYMAYKNKRNFDPVLFILSSSSFNQAVKRMGFIRTLGESRMLQIELIRKTQEDLQSQLAALELVRTDKSLLLGKKEEEKTNLEQDKSEENGLVKTLQQKEKELRKELAAKQKAAKKLDDQIKKIIREEIERARKEEEARVKKENPGGAVKKGTELAMTPEAVALSASFNANRGKLPWPVEKGFVVKGFGEHRHPTLPNVKTVNNGIDIVTTDGANARAVFQGEVRAIFSVPGMQNAVMINHGEFFTVYTHLETVLVKKGDKITTKQPLGKVFKDPDDAKTILHFELWKGNEKQDPEIWIFKN